jgi:hypothetical protein
MEQQNQNRNFWDKFETAINNNRKSGKQIEFAQKIKPHQLKIEMVLGVVVLMGLIMRYYHVSYSGVTLSISLILLSILYFFLAFAKYETDAKPKENVLELLTYILGWGKSVAIMGILFNLTKWTGAAVMLQVGCISLGIVILVSLIFNIYGNKSEIFKLSEIIRSFIILLATLSTYYYFVII